MTAAEGAVTVHHDAAGTVATVVVDCAAKLNALTLDMLEQLYQHLRAIDASDVRVVVVTTAGSKVFSVGADIDQFSALAAPQMWKLWIAEGHRVFTALAQLRQPTIAVVDGLALGGGLELALACDLRVGATHARFALPETALGTIPGWGGTERLTQVVGAARAKDMIFTRRQLDAATAKEWGLLTDVADAAELPALAGGLVDAVLGGGPIAVQLAKQLVNAAAAGAPSATLEAMASGFSASTRDFADGVAAFRSKTTPEFTNS
ncbi:enoyl-CoA hydratase/isomerase family protein [Mycolicibacterium sp. P1-18]|uniref:enoyl-CoA hydratase/isomerase family protein n=1 Tax=Mycolicibacterium sp. P1-18 TaxID=2024615 RepID=UPI0011F2F5C3|nr:enoyl-CoA hydratase/isomerase family protein [Mycolicibacterium sp. P1-18]KAA0102387.1 enoyl-CoA hydratase/isomerase family protein [Mycolicibacterium sp. P1-18]